MGHIVLEVTRNNRLPFLVGQQSFIGKRALKQLKVVIVLGLVQLVEFELEPSPH
jgi:hypothetical protein